MTGYTSSSLQTSQHSALILLPYPLGWGFEYAIPPGMVIKPGDIVQVPLGKRIETGVVWEPPGHLPAPLAPPMPQAIDKNRLRPIKTKLDIPPLPETLRHFIDWVAAYTLSAPGNILATSLRAMPLTPIKDVIQLWCLCPHPPVSAKITPLRQKVLAALAKALQQGQQGLSSQELAKHTHTSAPMVKGMEKAGLIEKKTLSLPSSLATDAPHFSAPVFSPSQANAAQELIKPLKLGRFCVTMLEGVTGSGKTEVYMQAVAETIAQNKQVLVLLPEIALSAQWVSRFKERFGVLPAIWHSDMGPKLRQKTWQAVCLNQAKVVVGARSALFLPFKDLGLIVVDEEHETTFKQEEGYSYNARDMSIIRAQLSQAGVILVSATPSLETYANIQSGKYRHVVLPNRHGTANMPHIEIIDMKKHAPLRGQFLSPILVKAISETFEKKQQAMLFLNRRGYAPLTLCRSCGHRLQCPHCTAWLVAHKNPPRLICHQCDYQEPIPHTCPSCGAEHSLAPIGPGIERIAEEARILFAGREIAIMASDTLTSPKATSHMVEHITSGKTELIIGTQSVAKGWHFPNLTLVGIVDADLSLAGGDLRAGEHTLQLLHQVAGRAGREKEKGQVFIQSYMPEHPVIQAIAHGDFPSFLKQESLQRQAGFWPPYGRMVAIIINADTEQKADTIARQMAKTAPYHIKELHILGPSTPPLAILRDQHRRRFLLRGPKSIFLQPIIRHWLSLIPKESQKHVEIDVDPYSFL